MMKLGEVLDMEEASMVEELKRLGYRVSKPKKAKPKEEFKPFVAIHKPLGSGLYRVEVIEEKVKTVRIRTQYGATPMVLKREIYEFNQKALDVYNGVRERLKEMRHQEEKIRDQSWKAINLTLKHRYEEEVESVGFSSGA